MAKQFVIVVVAVAIIAFSVSTFVFSDNNITTNLPVLTQSDDLDKQSVINEIDRCMQENLNGHMSVNSFNTNMLMNLKQSAMNACLLYTSPSPRDRQKSRMTSSA